MTRWLYLSIGATAASFEVWWYVCFVAGDLLPDPVPVHWNAHGQVDGTTTREKAWIYLGLMPAAMVLFTVLTFVFPWITPKRWDIGRFRGTWNYVMALVVLWMGYINLVLLWATTHPPAQDSLRLFFGGFTVFFALLGNVLGQVKPNPWMGIRTPWTLASERVWIKTHRMAAWMFVAFGVVGLSAAIADVWYVWVFVGGLLATIFTPIFYSLIVYKQLERAGKLESSVPES
jgi:uncharacterized membrane protein